MTSKPMLPASGSAVAYARAAALALRGIVQQRGFLRGGARSAALTQARAPRVRPG